MYAPLYNEVWAGNLDLSVLELPEAVKPRWHNGSEPRKNKKSYGKNISERPKIAALCIEEGHWEGNTVVGKKGSLRDWKKRKIIRRLLFAGDKIVLNLFSLTNMVLLGERTRISLKHLLKSILPTGIRESMLISILA